MGTVDKSNSVVYKKKNKLEKVLESLNELEFVAL